MIDRFLNKIDIKDTGYNGKRQCRACRRLLMQRRREVTA